MNPRTIMAVYAFLIGLAVVGTSNLAVISYADKPDEDDPPRNCFGQGASDFESGEMGEHSREGGAAGDAPFDDDDKPGRQGIGNVGDDDDTNLHPSELAEALGADCE